MNILFFLKPKATVSYLFSDFTVRQALEKMERVRYSIIPIIDREGFYIGTISEGDFLWNIKAQEDFSVKKAEEMKIADIKVNRSYKAININQDVEDLISLALDQNFVPVVDDRGFFIGIVTRKDIIEQFLKANVELNDL